jgi:hypothetical protein
MKIQSKISDFDIESMMGRLLITGVIISGTLILLGGFLYLSSFRQTNYQRGNSF